MPSLLIATCLNWKRPFFSSVLKVANVCFNKVGLALLLLLGREITECLYNLYALLQMTKVKAMISTCRFLNKHK